MFITNMKQNVKEWKWWFKLVLMILVTFTIMWDLVGSITNPAKEFIYTNTIEGQEVIITDYVGSLISFLSFFTIQSNIMVVLWLIVSLIFHKEEGEHRLLSPKLSMIVAVYITITMLIFNLVLLPELLMNAKPDEPMNPTNWGWFMWFRQMVLHLVGPLLFVIYILLFMNIKETSSTKQFLKHDSWKSLFYPLGYAFYVLIRIEVRIASGLPTTGASTYVYFFMNLRESWPMFIAVVFIVIGLCIGLSCLYNFIIGKRLTFKKQF